MDAYVGEVRAFAFHYVPQNWLPCLGQIVDARKFQALYALLGNTYGGSAQSYTFGLPNLQSMAPIGMGAGPGLTPRTMGKTYGNQTETLNSPAYLAPHTHRIQAIQPTSSNLDQKMQSAPTPGSSWLSQAGSIIDATHLRYTKTYFSSTTPPTLNAQFANTTIGVSCGNPNYTVNAHANVQPYLAITMCICWNGVFPSFN